MATLPDMSKCATSSSLTILFLFIAAPCSAQPAAAVSTSSKGPGGIVAIVGDDVITQADLDKKVDRRRLQFMGHVPSSAIEREISVLERAVLDNMISKKLILQLAKLEEKKGEGPWIAEADLDAEINRQVEDLKKKGERVRSPDDLYRITRENEGISREEYRRNVREELSVNKYLWQKVFKANDDFVPPLELKAYYQSHMDEFTTPAAIAFRQVIIKPSRDNTMDRLIEEVKKGIKANADFAGLAKQVAEHQGEDPEKAEMLWVMSFEDLKAWRQPIPETLRRMKKGETSDIVVTVNDLRFFKVEDLKPGTPKSFDEVQQQISKQIREARNQNSLEAFLQRQRKKTRVVDFLPELLKETPKAKEKG